MRISLRVLWIVGLTVFLALIVTYGAGEIASAVVALGWRLVPVCLLHVIPLVLHTIGWAVLLPRDAVRPLTSLLSFRWYGESVSTRNLSAGTILATSRSSPAFGNVTIPANESQAPMSSAVRAISIPPVKQ